MNVNLKFQKIINSQSFKQIVFLVAQNQYKLLTMEMNYYRWGLKLSGIAFYLMSLGYALRMNKYTQEILVVDDVNYLLFAVVLSVIGTGLIIAGKSMDKED